MAEDYKSLMDNSPKRFVGLKQVLRGITDGTVWCVIVSSDCEEFIERTLSDAISTRDVHAVKGPTMAELGKAAGIDVGAAVIGIVK